MTELEEKLKAFIESYQQLGPIRIVNVKRLVELLDKCNCSVHRGPPLGSPHTAR